MKIQYIPPDKEEEKKEDKKKEVFLPRSRVFSDGRIFIGSGEDGHLNHEPHEPLAETRI
jgi:6-phosphogluconolactonase/glucosamine-6-phosphate isomerase/deaminase